MEDAVTAGPPQSGETVCFGCRNRVDLARVVVLDSGVLCCLTCWERREVLSAPHLGLWVEVIG